MHYSLVTIREVSKGRGINEAPYKRNKHFKRVSRMGAVIGLLGSYNWGGIGYLVKEVGILSSREKGEQTARGRIYGGKTRLSRNTIGNGIWRLGSRYGKLSAG